MSRIRSDDDKVGRVGFKEYTSSLRACEEDLIEAEETAILEVSAISGDIQTAIVARFEFEVVSRRLGRRKLEGHIGRTTAEIEVDSRTPAIVDGVVILRFDDI